MGDSKKQEVEGAVRVEYDHIHGEEKAREEKAEPVRVGESKSVERGQSGEKNLSYLENEERYGNVYERGGSVRGGGARGGIMNTGRGRMRGNGRRGGRDSERAGRVRTDEELIEECQNREGEKESEKEEEQESEAVRYAEYEMLQEIVRLRTLLEEKNSKAVLDPGERGREDEGKLSENSESEGSEEEEESEDEEIREDEQDEDYEDYGAGDSEAEVENEKKKDEVAGDIDKTIAESGLSPRGGYDTRLKASRRMVGQEGKGGLPGGKKKK